MTDGSQGDLFRQDDPVTSADSLDAAHELIRGCTRCAELVDNRTQAVPGVGPTSPKVLFIGEAPGRWEDEKGEPFVGQAGAYLNELLERIGLRRSDVFITNVIKCRPPDNRDPRTVEMDNCAPYLEKQIALLRPTVIVLLGRVALERFFPGEKITQAAGTARTARIGGREVTVLPLLHPAFGIRRQDLKPEVERGFWTLRELLE